MREAAAQARKRVVFVASSALSHKLARDPASWPTPEHQALDRQFMAMLGDGRLGETRAFLPGYARETLVEMGGRNLASLLGTRAPTMDEVFTKTRDYAQRIKGTDPGALVAGPEEWGWSGYFYSGFDLQWGAAHGWDHLPDREAHGNWDYLPWMLDQLRQQQVASGRRVLIRIRRRTPSSPQRQIGRAHV